MGREVLFKTKNRTTMVMHDHNPTLRNFSGCSKIEFLELQVCGFTILEELGFSVFVMDFFPSPPSFLVLRVAAFAQAQQ
jgi:hypothetical protein